MIFAYYCSTFCQCSTSENVECWHVLQRNGSASVNSKYMLLYTGMLQSQTCLLQRQRCVAETEMLRCCALSQKCCRSRDMLQWRAALMCYCDWFAGLTKIFCSFSCEFQWAKPWAKMCSTGRDLWHFTTGSALAKVCCIVRDLLQLHCLWQRHVRYVVHW